MGSDAGSVDIASARQCRAGRMFRCPRSSLPSSRLMSLRSPAEGMIRDEAAAIIVGFEGLDERHVAALRRRMDRAKEYDFDAPSFPSGW